MLSALKYSEDDTGIILRVYETNGSGCDFQASGDALPVTLQGTITPWSVMTYYLSKDGLEWKEVLLTEYEEIVERKEA